MTSHIGIYSGTFDPIHQGHISFALEALRVCKLDKIVFLPEPLPRGKHSVSDIDHRVTSIEKVIAIEPDLSVVRPVSAQFTVRGTLPELHNLFEDATITLLIGSDIVRTFPHRWDNLDILLGEVSLAIGMRDNDKKSEMIAIISELEAKYNMAIHYTFIHTPHSAVTSSQIRKGTKVV